MDLSILATEVKDEVVRGVPKAQVYVKKSRHHDCDDSALLLVKEDYVLLGVFDGVSGHAFASSASETAVQAIRQYVQKNFKKKSPEELVESAMEEANFAVQRGGTTASIVLVLNDGRFYFANVGDSHVYIYTHGIIQRKTKEDRDSSGLTQYLSNRYVVTQCLGGLLHSIDKGHGKLEKGDMLLVMTDGFVDNFFIETEGGRVIDASGKKDLETLLHGKKEVKEIVQMLSLEIKRRMQQPGQGIREGAVLVPKEDDAAMAILKF